MGRNKKPKISIITVSYNAALSIESTILSVLNQSYCNIEYIIIDGGSTDGTVDIIKRYDNKISYWVSESDNGIYDAMNKGILQATGEWINFMNSGDSFVEKDVIKNIFFNEIDDSYAVVYGNTEFVYADRIQIIKQVNDEVHKYMPACHQSIFCRTIEMKKRLFDTKLKIAADFKFFYLLYSDGAVYLYKDVTVSRYNALDGISSKNRFLCYKERIRITNSFIRYIFFISVFRLKTVYLSIIKK